MNIAFNHHNFLPVSIKLGVDPWTVDLYRVKVKVKVIVETFHLEALIACIGRGFQPISKKISRDLCTEDLHQVKVTVVAFDLEALTACKRRVFKLILVKLGRDLYTDDLHQVKVVVVTFDLET